MKNLANELLKRVGKDDEVDAILGAEIRYRRASMSQTLYELCEKICSISYLSKIESNQIKPNPKLLETICKKVHISKQNVETIRESKKLFVDCMVAFMNNEEATLEYISKQVDSMKNYRAKIIKLFYLVFKKDVKASSKLIADLEKTLAAIPNQDLLVLTMLEAYHCYNINSIKESFNLINIMDEFMSEFEECELMCLHLLVEIYERTNSPLLLEVCENLKSVYFKTGLLEKAYKLNDKINFYYLKNGLYSKLKKLKNPMERDKFKIYIDAIEKNIIEYDIKAYDFGLGFYLYNTNKELFVETLEQFKNRLTEDESLVLSLLKDSITCETFEDRVDKIYMKKALEKKDVFLMEFVLGYLIDALAQKAKYKRISVLVKEIKGIKDELKCLC